MSTKIHNAFKVTDKEKFMELLVDYRKKIIEEYEEKKSNILRVYAIWLFDELDLFKTKCEITKYDWTKNIGKFKEVFNKNRTEYVIDYSHPFDCKLVYYVNEGLGYFVGGGVTPHYNKILELGKGIIEEYEYYNNVDGPEEISEQAWKKREEDWDSVTAGSDYVLGAGYKKGIEITLFEEDVTYILGIEGRKEQIRKAMMEYLELYGGSENIVRELATVEEKTELDNYRDARKMYDYMEIYKELKKKYKENYTKAMDKLVKEYLGYVKISD